LDADNLKKVTPSATSAKTHYVIVDAIGVTKSLKTASQPLITKPGVPLKDLATGVMMGARDEDTVSSLAGRLARLEKQLDDKDQERIREAAGGLSLSDIVRHLVDAIDTDRIEAIATQDAKGAEPTDEMRASARDKLVGKAANVFTGPLINLIDGIRREKEQTIDHDNLDTLTEAGWSGDAKENAEALAKDFAAYLEEHRNQIEALTIFYSQPARRSEVTYAMIKAVLDALKTDRPKLAPLRVWRAYALLDEYKGADPANELTALVALIRRVCGIDSNIAPFADTVRRNFQSWILKRHSGSGHKFTGEQLEWLQMIRDHVTSSIHVERDDLDMAPFNAKGGLGKMYQLFGESIDAVIDELNEALVA
jgi:type I restriction enzyme R subunit